MFTTVTPGLLNERMQRVQCKWVKGLSLDLSKDILFHVTRGMADQNTREDGLLYLVRKGSYLLLASVFFFPMSEEILLASCCPMLRRSCKS